MRYFKLENSSGSSFDITNEEFFFHDVTGLGFDEENNFRRVGPVWRLTSTAYAQSKPGGKMMFTEYGSGTPYDKYDVFKRFISQPPLTLIYYPNGLGTTAYRKKVRVSKLGKTEITELGVLDCDIEFVSYSPWYEIRHYEIIPITVDENAGWIWDVGNSWDRSDEDLTSPRYKFGAEARNEIIFDCESNMKGLIKLTINGPAINPVWTHHVDGKVVELGGFAAGNDVTLTESDRLIIDNTEGQYSMIIENTQTLVKRNVYSLQDFDKECFFTIEGGRNMFAVASADETALNVELEGHFHYATV